MHSEGRGEQGVAPFPGPPDYTIPDMQKHPPAQNQHMEGKTMNLYSKSYGTTTFVAQQSSAMSTV
jgi:hypothetical protein